jgi:predicted nucleic acid-binding protein
MPDRRSERAVLIAATSLVHAMTVVTRNIAAFEPSGAGLLNP